MDMSFNEFVQWLLYSGGANILVSIILERIPKFHELSKDAKWFVSAAFAVVMAVSIWLLQKNLPVELLTEWIDPLFRIVAGILIPNGVMQGYHKLTKE